MASRNPLPVTRAILLADMIIAEAGTHKKTLVGIYSRITTPHMPLRKVLHVYAQVADARGEYRMTIRLVRLETGEVVNEGEIGPIVSRDPLAPLEIVMHLPCVFNNYGEYEFVIIHDGNVFASKRFSLLEPPEPTDDDPLFDRDLD